MNGKGPIQIVIEEPTPPNTIREVDTTDKIANQNRTLADVDADIEEINDAISPTNTVMAVITEETIEQNEEKEAKIIDLLDQVIQAEEDTYGDDCSMIEARIEEQINSTASEPITPHRKSFSNLSDAGSDASLGNPGLSQYDVVAQVHREDLPKLVEENIEDENDLNKLEDEQVTFFNDSETASRTDESGYSDTTDNNLLNESIEELKESQPYIPPPPPLDENFFVMPLKKPYTIAIRPMINDEVARRDSIKSTTSNDNTIVFGSERQQSFSTKLSGILLKQVPTNQENEKVMKRSNSINDLTEIDVEYRERPSLFLDLKKEITAGDRALKPVKIDNKANDELDKKEDEEEVSKQDIKSRLESIFASGGAQLVKPRLIKSFPPAPEEKRTVVTLERLPKVEKSDTLKLQKAKFNEVLNSFKMLAKDDQV